MTSGPEPGPTSAQPLLEVSNLNVTFPSEAGPVMAVRGLSYEVAPGEVLGIVGPRLIVGWCKGDAKFLDVELPSAF